MTRAEDWYWYGKFVQLGGRLYQYLGHLHGGKPHYKLIYPKATYGRG